MIKNYINHIALVLDKSGSMSGLTAEVIKVFDATVKHLALLSQQSDQETRISCYLFADTVECLIYDKDVLRLPSIKEFYKPSGNTALIDATLKAIEDLEKTATLYGDHSFLIYTLTDGENNRNGHRATELLNKIKGLPENYTIACLAPNQTAVFAAKSAGFSANNIQIWSTDNKGIHEVAEVVKQSTSAYFQARSQGVRGTKNLFNIDLAKVNVSSVRSALQELSAKDYLVLPIRQDGAPIKEYVENFTKLPYVQGSAYYELTKKETVQSNKQVAIQNKLNGKIYSGLNARNMLGLPNQEVKVAPSDFGDWNLFIQSNSVNRKLVKGTNLLVLK